MAAQLDQIDPLLQRIYATADPHPSFRAVRLLTKVARGRGRLNAAVFDPHADLSTDSPETVLSSSQLNALAVSVCLALNLGFRPFRYGRSCSTIRSRAWTTSICSA